MTDDQLKELTAIINQPDDVPLPCWKKIGRLEAVLTAALTIVMIPVVLLGAISLMAFVIVIAPFWFTFLFARFMWNSLTRRSSAPPSTP